MSDEAYADERRAMVRDQIVARGLTDPRLATAFEAVPRHLFVSPEYRAEAYEDHPLPIGSGQTISQPYIVALMLSLLDLRGSERVLEIGTGTGYEAALLARLAGEIHTVELLPELAARAREALAEAGAGRVEVHLGDGSLGWPDCAPYHAIVVAAAAPSVPQPLLDQLAEGGRLVLPVVHRSAFRSQVLERWTRTGAAFDREELVPVAFVPLRGRHGLARPWWQR